MWGLVPDADREPGRCGLCGREWASRVTAEYCEYVCARKDDEEIL